MRVIHRMFLGLLLFTGLNARAQSEVPYITDPRLDIKMPGVSGDTLTLSALKGKVVLLDFWASWCVPCRAANRKLVSLYAKYKDKGFEIFGVSLDESEKDWKRAIEKDKISWLQVIDPRGWEAETAIRWNISALPTNFLVNKEGKVVGYNLEGKQLEKAIRSLLRE